MTCASLFSLLKASQKATLVSVMPLRKRSLAWSRCWRRSWIRVVRVTLLCVVSLGTLVATVRRQPQSQVPDAFVDSPAPFVVAATTSPSKFGAMSGVIRRSIGRHGAALADHVAFPHDLSALPQDALRSVRTQLKQASFFRDLTLSQFNAITEHLRREEYEAGAQIIRQGEHGDRLYILLDGVVHVSVTTPAGDHKVGEYTKHGEYFGELALLQNTTRRANVVAATHTTVLWLSRSDFERTVGPLRKLLLENAAVRPADAAVQFVQKMSELAEPSVGLQGVQVQLFLWTMMYLVFGTAYYTWSGFEELQGNSWVAGFYYAVQAGLAVGFGKLSPRNEFAPFFTFAYVLLGAALLANFLSTLIADALEKGEEESDQRAQQRAKTGVCSTPPLRTIAPLAAWWAVGIAFGRLHENWDWGTSAMFAISATSSVGLQSTTSNDDVSLLFCALYCLIGVPLYAWVLGRFCLRIADMLLETRRSAIRERAVQAVQQCDDECLVELFDIFDKNHDGKITQEEAPELIRFLSMSKSMDVTDTDVAYLMEEFDLDSNGSINDAEFVRGLRRWNSYSRSEAA